MFGLLVAAAAVAANPEVALGRWMTETKHGVVQIDRCGLSICGRILSSDQIRGNPELLDLRNSNPQLRSRKLLGLQILGGFTASGSAWTGGCARFQCSQACHSGGTLLASGAPLYMTQRGSRFFPLVRRSMK